MYTGEETPDTLPALLWLPRKTRQNLGRENQLVTDRSPCLRVHPNLKESPCCCAQGTFLQAEGEERVSEHLFGIWQADVGPWWEKLFKEAAGGTFPAFYIELSLSLYFN